MAFPEPSWNITALCLSSVSGSYLHMNFHSDEMFKVADFAISFSTIFNIISIFDFGNLECSIYSLESVKQSSNTMGFMIGLKSF